MSVRGGGGNMIPKASDERICELHFKHKLNFTQIRIRTGVTHGKISKIIRAKYVELGLPMPNFIAEGNKSY